MRQGVFMSGQVRQLIHDRREASTSRSGEEIAARNRWVLLIDCWDSIQRLTWPHASRPAVEVGDYIDCPIELTSFQGVIYYRVSGEDIPVQVAEGATRAA